MEELRAELKSYDLPTSGSRSELLLRLKRRKESDLGCWEERGSVKWSGSSRLLSSSGPCGGVPPGEANPLELLSLFWDDGVWGKFLSSSNAYEQEQGQVGGKRERNSLPIPVEELKS